VQVAHPPGELAPVEVLEQRLRVLARRPELVAHAGDRRAAVALAQVEHPLREPLERLGVEVEVPRHPHRVPAQLERPKALRRLAW
jgi:hypothetical protein